MEIEWTDADPLTGGRRYVCAVKFARKWAFKVRLHRRAEWDKSAAVTRDMWETLLDALERRYRRREGVTDEDLAAVRKQLAEFREPPEIGEEELTTEPQRPQRQDQHREEEERED
jgi:hypothetical protein